MYCNTLVTLVILCHKLRLEIFLNKTWALSFIFSKIIGQCNSFIPVGMHPLIVFIKLIVDFCSIASKFDILGSSFYMIRARLGAFFIASFVVEA